MKRVLGFRQTERVSKKTGNPYIAFTVYLASSDSLSGLTGESCEEVFIVQDTFNSILNFLGLKSCDDFINMEFKDFTYNRFGSVVGILK